jgi:hypothetical protein
LIVSYNGGKLPDTESTGSEDVTRPTGHAKKRKRFWVFFGANWITVILTVISQIFHRVTYFEINFLPEFVGKASFDGQKGIVHA